MDVITFGESMVLFNPDTKGPLRYINNFTKSIAGAESNVAIALARLDHEVGWFSKLGNDEFGRYIKGIIRGEGVDVSRVRIDEIRSTGLLFKERFSHVNPNVYYYRKNSAASNIMVEDLDYEYIKSAKILHITGITLALSETNRQAAFEAIKVAKENNVLVSFDPNIRLKLWSKEEAKEVLLKVASLADIILPGEDEGEILLGTNKPDEIATKFMEMGCSIVVVKLGKEGCFVANKEKREYVSGFPVEKVEDTVGAGDGFAAGFLSGILKNFDITKCGKYANGIGAMATLVSGDMEGYPTKSQLMEFIGEESHIDR